MDTIILIIITIMSPFVWLWANFKKFLIWTGVIKESETINPPIPKD